VWEWIHLHSDVLGTCGIGEHSDVGDRVAVTRDEFVLRKLVIQDAEGILRCLALGRDQFG
jgi:hypothetical protein